MRSKPQVFSTRKQSKELPTVLAGMLTVLTVSTAPAGMEIWNPWRMERIWI